MNISPRRLVALFLVLLVAVRGPFYAAALIGPWTKESKILPWWMFALLVVSAPPMIAIGIRLFTQRNVRDLGWKPGRVRYLVAGLAFPIAVAFLVYGIAYAAGAIARVPGQNDGVPTLVAQAAAMSLALVIPTLLFEELGWRGFLVPEMAKFLSFGKVALFSGIITALFHYPFLIHPDYAEVPPSVSSVLAFTAAITMACFPLAWLTLRSGSVWPATLAHAAHNATVLDVIGRTYQPTGPVSAAIVGESGWGLAAGYAIIALWCWKHRGEVEAVSST